MKSKLDMKDLGRAKKIFEMDIHGIIGKSKLFLNQADYVEKVLHKFVIYKSKPASIPLGIQFKLSTEQCPTTKVEKEDMICVFFILMSSD